MRNRAVLALTFTIAAACGGDWPSPPPKIGQQSWSGPDAILIRAPLAGGPARAYRWGRDSAVWTSADPAPALTRFLAFDEDQGVMLYVDAKGTPGGLDLRLRTVTPAARAPLQSLASVDGWAAFGISGKQEVTRLTPSGDWKHGTAFTPQMLLPQPDGSLIMLNDLGDRSVLRRLIPPESRIVDTASVPTATFAVTTLVGDRVYFLTDSGLAALRVRGLERAATIRLPGPSTDAASTPSGDRIFVAIVAEPIVAVVDRYADRVASTIRLKTPASALRMDPDGRYLLAARDTRDSVDVISVAGLNIVATLGTTWRNDLPLVGPDGWILMADSADVVDLNPVSGKRRRTYAGGASDLWSLVRWNGFRPRARGLDRPVEFEADSADTAAVAPPDSGASRINEPARAAAAPVQTPAAPPSRAEPPPAAAPTGWTLSFAALLDEQRARAQAATIRIDGRPARVVGTPRDGTMIWRVVAGPFATREEAERAGRRTGLPYWVYEDTP